MESTIFRSLFHIMTNELGLKLASRITKQQQPEPFALIATPNRFIRISIFSDFLPSRMEYKYLSSFARAAIRCSAENAVLNSKTILRSLLFCSSHSSSQSFCGMLVKNKSTLTLSSTQVQESTSVFLDLEIAHPLSARQRSNAPSMQLSIASFRSAFICRNLQLISLTLVKKGQTLLYMLQCIC